MLILGFEIEQTKYNEFLQEHLMFKYNSFELSKNIGMHKLCIKRSISAVVLGLADDQYEQDATNSLIYLISSNVPLVTS